MGARATYQGDGNEYIPGVPRRDIDQSEYDALDTEQRKAVRDTKRGDGKSLYDVATDKEAAHKPAEKGAN